MAYRKRLKYRTRKYYKRKYKSRMGKLIAKRVKQAIYKLTDIKTNIFRNQFNPALANYITATAVYMSVDPTFAVSQFNRARNSESAGGNWWGNSVAPKGWDQFAAVPFLLGNTIKRIGFSIKYHWYANWYTGLAAPYTLLVNNNTASDIMSGQYVESRFRVSIVRAQKGIDDDTLETYLGNLPSALIEDTWNKSYCNVLYDRFHRTTASGVGNGTSSGHVSKRFSGKKGKQKINLPINDAAGTLVQSYEGQGKLYIVLRLYPYTYLNGGVTYQLLPHFDKFMVSTKYIDI